MAVEIHQIISAASPDALLMEENAFLSLHPDYEVTFRRYFLSSREQKAQLGARPGNVSYVIQPVLGGDVIAVWLYLVKDCPVELLWRTNMYSHMDGPELQTREIFESYEADLERSGLDIADDCVRTWIYVDDIDENYHGVVVGRRDNFTAHGMTRDSHYLASTGIFGAAVEPGTTVQMDALAIRGQFSQRYLYAPDNFCLTHDYGVTFERGVVLEYGDGSHVLISGTASINNKGEVVHPGDVEAQTGRMLENVESLLKEAGCGWGDVRMMTVYLRNASDYAKVAPVFERRFGSTIPRVITHAPVCRPGWLIEMECIAVKQNM